MQSNGSPNEADRGSGHSIPILEITHLSYQKRVQAGKRQSGRGAE